MLRRTFMNDVRRRRNGMRFIMRNVLIFGGSRGIGAAMVRRFAEAGDRVSFTWNRAEDAAKALAAETGAEAIRADVTDGEEVVRAVRQSERRFSDCNRERPDMGLLNQEIKQAVPQPAGHNREDASQNNDSGIDVLICNAGVSLSRMLMDTTDGEYRQVMDTNLYGTFAAIRAALPGMFWRRKGVILTVSSIWGQSGASCEAVYSASKAAVIGLTQAVAKETAGAGIRVNCIAPGMIDTAMNDHLSAEEKEEIAGEIPMQRMGKPAEVAETAFFLASDAASYITGQVIPVNGGWFM